MEISLLSSLHDDCKSEDIVDPHYKECYRLAIDALVDGGVSAYQEFLKKESTAEFLADAEINHITNNLEKPIPVITVSDCEDHHDDTSSSGTYWPIESDIEAPNLDIGWPFVQPGLSGRTSIDLYFHPPRGTSPTIKETVRKLIKDARQVIAVVMDMFTDVDIFKEIVEASTRGIPVYLLLEDSNFNYFHNMAEKQGVQVQRLRNMRVRTVKGHDYLCRSGAKFHGSMSQRFLLVDCHTVIYGSYSFMWSFEKINLSMVQRITGQLVESFDEEFRTLYARSQIPSIYAQEEFGSMTSLNRVWENGSYQNSVSSFASSSNQRNIFDRKAKMRHTLDAVYLRARARQQPNAQNHMGDDDNFRTLAINARPPTGLNVQAKILQVQNSEATEHWKRHSYAGEKPENPSYLLHNRIANFRSNAPSSNWKAQVDSSSVASSQRGDYLSSTNETRQNVADRYKPRLTQLLERNSTIRSSFHGTDNRIRTLQQKMPTLERTTKTFLRNWRIESYLNDHSEYPPDTSGDASDYDLGGTESAINPLYTHSRLRSSIVLQSTFPEKRELDSYTSSSTSTVTSQGSQSVVQMPNSYHTNSRFATDGYLTTTGTMSQYQPSATESSTYGYSTLSRNANRQTDQFKTPHTDIYTLKRRSLNLYDDSKSYLDNNPPKGVSSYMYSTAGRNTVRQTDYLSAQQDESYGTRIRSLQHLNDQRSNQDQSFKKEWTYTTGNTTVNGPPSRAVSNSSLTNNSTQEHSNQSSVNKELKESATSPRFLLKGSQKIKSLLNLTTDKKENLSKNKSTSFYKMCSSSDTLTSDDEDKQKRFGSKKHLSSTNNQSSQANSQHSLDKQENVSTTAYSSLIKSTSHDDPKITNSSLLLLDNNQITGDSSAPRFNTEPLQYQDAMDTKKNSVSATGSAVHGETETKNPNLENFKVKQEGITRSRFSDKRVYSRFEPFCNIENANQRPGNAGTTSIQSSELVNRSQGNDYLRFSSSLPRNTSAGYQAYQQPENKFGRFIQKVGNFIHKNK